MKAILQLLTPAIAVLVAAYLLPGAHVDSFLIAILVALTLGFLNMFVKPVLEILTIPITIITLGIFLIILDAFMILVAAKLIDGFTIENIMWAIIFAAVVSFASTIMHKILK